MIVVVPETLGQDVIEIKSESGNVYRVDTVNGRCSCPAWKFRRRCKHLAEMGIPTAPKFDIKEL